MSLKAGRVGVNPKNVEIPDGSIKPAGISMGTPVSVLSGVKNDLESSIHGIADVYNADSEITIVKGTADTSNPAFLRCCGNVVTLFFRLKNVTAGAYETLLTIPNKYKPVHNIFFDGRIAGGGGLTYFQLTVTEEEGNPVAVQCADALTNKEVYNYALTWII